MDLLRWLLFRCSLWGVCVVAMASTSASAQFLSPGELSSSHASLEGLKNCLQCHEQGERLSRAKCLECHQPIASRLQAKRGYHQRVSTQSCESCHAEHKGRGHQLIQFEPSERAFNHSLTGWRLDGAHRQVSCRDCHQAALVVDDVVRERLQRPKKQRTFLGVGTDCVDCHFDEHRGQLSSDCKACHDTQSFTPAPGFNHGDDTKWPLVGKHLQVDCGKCHFDEPGVEPFGLFPAPRSTTFAHYKPIEASRCIDCHQDPHKGQFGVNCQRCHSEAGWDVLPRALKDVSFHEQTRFPLVGQHQTVDCALCHGPFARRARQGEERKRVDAGRTKRWSVPQYKNLTFARCDDCHYDGHGGQLHERAAQGQTLDGGVVVETRPQDCSACHSEKGFWPAGFEPQNHGVDGHTRFALDGAHRATPCQSCHLSSVDIKKRGEAAALDVGGMRRSTTLFSERRLRVDDDNVPQCAKCHDDVHHGQFTKDGVVNCASCHATSAWTTVTFDHDTTDFPLRDAHEGVDCDRCHGPDEVTPRSLSSMSPSPAEREWPMVVAVDVRPGIADMVFDGVDQDCSSCHTDTHRGQLARDDKTDCTRCHEAAAWSPASKFAHNDVTMTSFALEGRHTDVDCASCHPGVDGGDATDAGGDGGPVSEVAWYRGVPQDCAGCHVDQHGGRFAKFATFTSTTLAIDGVIHTKAQSCDACHAVQGWQPAQFNHDLTGYTLDGAHAKAWCVDCHADADDHRKVGTACIDCHRDPHRAVLGVQCASCHTSTSWRSTMDVSAHLLTGFPLSGRHGALPCQECHQNDRDLGFRRPATSCESCHANDYLRAGASSLDHAVSRVSTDCKMCHQPTRFSPATFAQHERCWPLDNGAHRGVQCRSCHASVAGLVANGACETNNPTCTSCHEHRESVSASQHNRVDGYSWFSSRCVGCHRGT